jgi:hypothetical protein
MSFFRRETGKGNQPGENLRKYGGPSRHSPKAEKGREWRTAKYQKLSENQKSSVDRILTVLEYQIQ